MNHWKQNKTKLLSWAWSKFKTSLQNVLLITWKARHRWAWRIGSGGPHCPFTHTPGPPPAGLSHAAIMSSPGGAEWHWWYRWGLCPVTWGAASRDRRPWVSPVATSPWSPLPPSCSGPGQSPAWAWPFCTWGAGDRTVGTQRPQLHRALGGGHGDKGSPNELIAPKWVTPASSREADDGTGQRGCGVRWWQQQRSGCKGF